MAETTGSNTPVVIATAIPDGSSTVPSARTHEA